MRTQTAMRSVEDVNCLMRSLAFGSVGAHRLESRVLVQNGRANGALRKLGAVEECLLRKSFLRDGDYADQILWSIVEDDWLTAESRSLLAKTVWGTRVH